MDRTTYLMVTGHRQIRHPDAVRDALGWLLASSRDIVAFSGGAEGADTLFCQAAMEMDIPFRLYLPNIHYRHAYPDSVSDDIVKAATHVFYAVTRPPVIDWRTCWEEGRWWTDNFERNKMMARAADDAVVVSPHPPDDLLRWNKGGTVHCVKTIKARGHNEVWWVPDTADTAALRCPLGEPALFEADTAAS